MAKLIQIEDETYSILLKAKARLMAQQTKHITFNDVLQFLIEQTGGSDAEETARMG